MNYSIHPQSLDQTCHARHDQLIGFESSPTKGNDLPIAEKFKALLQKQGGTEPKAFFPEENGTPQFTPIHTKEGWRLQTTVTWRYQEGHSWKEHQEVVVIDPFEDYDPTMHLGTRADKEKVANALLDPRKSDEYRQIANLLQPDVILISHNHRDHFDEGTLKELGKRQPVIIVPNGDRKLTEGLGFQHVYELDWGETAMIPFMIDGEIHELEVIGAPAKHVAQHEITDLHHSGTNGYFFRTNAFGQQNEKDNYHWFVGDSAVLDKRHQEAIRERINTPTLNAPAGLETSGHPERRHMASTHQSTADSLEQFFRNSLAVTGGKRVSKGDLVKLLRQRRLTYNHHLTFMLGTLTQDEGPQSVFRIMQEYEAGGAVAGTANARMEQKSLEDALQKKVDEGKLKFWELEAIKNLEECRQSLNTECLFDGQELSFSDILQLMKETVIMPLIGETAILADFGDKE